MDFDSLLEQKNIRLNPQQREAVVTTEGPLLLLAVPGSGKTTVVVARCAHLTLMRGVPAGSILTLTFNRAARLDMEARYRRLFGDETQGCLRFSTIHSFCNSVLNEYGRLVGRRVPRLIEEGKPKLLRELYAAANDGDYLADDRLDELANAIGFVKNSMMTDADVKNHPWEIRNFSQVFESYERYKNENGYMDFDDMLDKALAAFKVRPQILERFREQYRYVQVDEAQDTSRLQHAIIRMLAAPRNNLFMVGDEDQSIYLFRAADPAYLLRFQQDYPGGRVLLMERNYRSTAAIVGAAASLIDRNGTRRKKHMTTEAGAGPTPVETVLEDNSKFTDHVVARLHEHGAAGAAVLFRENASAVPLMDALDREGIPFTVREHKLYFFDHWVVRDLLAFLALARDPGDLRAFRQVYFKLNAWISRDLMDRAEAMAQEAGVSAMEALLSCPDVRENTAQRVRKLQANLIEMAALPPGDAIGFAMDRLGYGQYLEKTGGEGFYRESLLQVVESLRSVASRTGSLDELRQRIATLAELPARARGAGGVTLSTVHSAKGLEFDHVIVADLIEGRFPSSAAVAGFEKGNPQLMEEERRLCYVAVTRARSRVELVAASAIYGQKVKPSRFIRELLPRIPVRRVASRLDQKVSALLAPKAPYDPSASAETFPVEPGMEVFHKSFGTGVVESVHPEGGTADVRFPKVGLKTLAAEYCVGAGIMKKRKMGEQED